MAYFLFHVTQPTANIVVEAFDAIHADAITQRGCFKYALETVALSASNLHYLTCAEVVTALPYTTDLRYLYTLEGTLQIL